jgi:hypothetical protein
MNVYEIITSRILESLTSGVVPWRCPWSTEVPRNLVSGRDYRGVNVLLLQSAGYSSPHWVTFNQARALKGCVKRGERGCPVIFWKVTEKESAAKSTEKGFILRYYTVFNVAAQTEGIPTPKSAPRTAFDPIDEHEHEHRGRSPRVRSRCVRARQTKPLRKLAQSSPEGLASELSRNGGDDVRPNCARARVLREADGDRRENHSTGGRGRVPFLRRSAAPR